MLHATVRMSPEDSRLHIILSRLFLGSCCSPRCWGTLESVFLALLFTTELVRVVGSWTPCCNILDMYSTVVGLH
jgi:hypothetical protein